MFSSGAQAAGNAANGATKWVASCGAGGCHNATPTKPQLNAANPSDSSVLDYVIANNFGGAMSAAGAGLTAQNKLDLTAYFDSLITAGSVTVAYHGTSTDVPLKLTHDAAPISVYTSISYSAPSNGTVATGTDVSSNSFAGGYPLKEYTVAYTHTANNCSSDSFTATATGPGGTSTARTVNVTITAPTAPNISTSATTSSPAYNTATAIPITSTGGPISSITVTSGLTHGGSLVTNGTTSFTYTSNSATYSATDSFTYRANGPCANSATVTVNISISAPPTPVINSTLTASGATGVAFGGYTITATNLPASYGASGLPPGLSINTATGAITGTPTSSGTYNATISAINSSGTGNATLVFTIALSAPSITSTLTANGATGAAFSYSIVATNSPTSYNATGLPSGLSINTSTGVISGTPAVNGTSNVTISATNATATDSKTLVINISLTAPSITSSLTASGSTGVVFSGYTITATNSPTSFNATGLPPGLNVNTSTGAITGTPTTNGTYNTSISATNATATDTQTLVFTIALSAPSITSTLTANGATSVAFGGYTITATNSPTSYGASGLPPGLTINTSTGVISGTPTLNGTFNTTITAANATSTDSKTLVFTIALTAPSITSANTASGTYGVAFSYQITASNLPTSYGASGLPTGVSLNASTGLISGTPTAGGTYNATVSATNATGTASQAVTMTIAFTVPTTGAVSTSVPYNTATAVALTVGGQFTQVNVASAPSHGTAPAPAAGVTTLTYTPTAGYTGSDSFTYTATGPGGTSSAATVTITVSTLIPTAGSTTMTIPVNTATSLDLAPFITGSAISGISVSTQASHGTTAVSGTRVTYTPTNNYFGTDSFSYVAYGSGGTSTTPGVVTVTISGRPDPTQDAAVTGLIHAQIDTARRFTHAQIVNFTGRLESLHRSSSNRNTDVASLVPTAETVPLRAVATDKVSNDNRSDTQTSRPQPSANKPIETSSAQPNANADRSAVPISSDPMGLDSPITNSSPKSKQPALVGKSPASAVTAIQNSSLNASQSTSNPDAAKRLMGDGVRFGVRDLANQTAQPANPLVVLASALSAASNVSSQSAAIGKSLTTAMSAIQSSSLNLTSSTGNDDGTSALPGGFDYWIGGGVRFGTRDQTSTSNGLDFTTDGISIGVDKRINDQFAAGMGVGFGRDKTTIGTDGTNSKAHSTTIAAYGSYQPIDAIFIDGVIGYGSLRYKTDRYISAITDFAHADRSGDQVFTSLTTGYEYRTQGLHLSPYGRLDLAVNRLQQSTETGAGAYALTYNSQSIQSTAFSLGLRAETAHTMNFGWVLPRMRIEFQHDFKGEPQTSVSYADQPATPYAITSTTTNQNSILFGLGSDFLLRSGLRLSLDYQMQRSSMHDNSQAMLFKLTKELDGKAPSPLLLATSGFSLRDWKIRGDAGYTFDDNINRSSTAAERMSDSSYNAELTKSWLVPVTDHTRLVVGSALGGEKFHTYTGLDRMYLSSQVEYQYRASGNFGTPIWGVFANATGEAYSSALRDGYRYSGGISVRKPVTDRINIFSALAHNERHGRSAVFETRDNSFKFNLDYAATENSTLYLNTEYRRGDLVSSGSHSLQSIDIAKVFTLDDVFTRNDFYDYRFDGSTALLTLGYNLPFGPKDSIDISWQRVRSAASKAPSVAGWPSNRYYDNQLSIIYLFSF